MLLFHIIVVAQNSQPIRILFVYDASQSMTGKWESGTKMEVAKKLLSQMLDSLSQVENIELALRVYGHQSYVPPQDCNDTKLEVPFEKNNIEKIKHKLRQITAKGTTPIAHSLSLCANDFPDNQSRNIIILITDGIEACDGDPCAVSRELQKKGIFLKPFVIGIGLDVGLKRTFECVGNYYDAAKEDRFNEVLKIVISQVLNNTTCQVNLLDVNYQPTETNVNMSFYNHRTGALMYNYIHTINAAGYPDTLLLDPLQTYDMVVHTIPPVQVDSIKMVAGKHTTISANTPQGSLIVKSTDKRLKPNIVVHQNDQREIINVQSINIKEKYIIGTYDLEILTLPRIILEDVKIKPDQETKIEIPSSGVVTVSHRAKGYGSLYVWRGDQMEWIYNLNENRQQETLDLLPGKYTVVFRSKGVYKSDYSRTENFKVVSKRSLHITIDY